MQNFNQTIACSATCIFVCNILKLSLTKKHIEWSQFHEIEILNIRQLKEGSCFVLMLFLKKMNIVR